MKYVNNLWIALLLLLTVGVTSCMNSFEEMTPENGGVVEVLKNGDMVYFKDVLGKIIYPTPGSLKSVSENNKFDAEKSKTAYVLYKYDVENAESGLVRDADLFYAAKLDGTVEKVEKAGAPNDSVATSAIISVDKVMLEQKDDLFVMNNRYLLLGVNYVTAENLHFFTVTYNKDELGEKELKLYLRQTGTPEKDGIFRTSEEYFRAGYPFMYLFTFDLKEAFELWRMQHPDAMAVDLVLEADVNILNSRLDSSSKKQYRANYKFRD